MLKALVNVYVRMVKNGSRTIDEIPEAYREAVNAIINPEPEETEEEISDDGSDEE